MSDESEFTIFANGPGFESIYDRLQEAFENDSDGPEVNLGVPFNETGETWGLLGNPVSVHDNPGHGTMALMHVGFVLLLLALVAGYTYTQIKKTKSALIPDAELTVRTFVELLVGATYGLMKDIMGAKAAKFFLPLIGTCAFMILFSNALGLVPGFVPPTSSLSLTLAMGVIIFFSTHIFGVREHGLAYFKHFFGPKIGIVWIPLMLLMLVIELISHIVRPVSLGIRLMANMFADHLVLAKFGMLAGMVCVLIGLPELPLLLPVPALLLGSLVVVVQTMVFCILSTVYIAMAIEHAEDH